VIAARIPVAAGFTLAAEAEWRPGAAAAVICHPHPAFGGRMDTPLVLDLADALAAAGWSTLRFNFRGLDGSGGSPTGGLAEHEDVVAAVAWARANGAAQVALVGYSFGALMAARAIAAGTSVASLAAVGFPTTILGEDVERTGDLVRALDRRLPWLFVNGDADQFCEVERLRGWVAERPWARLEILPGRGHFFAGADADEVCRRVVAFTTSHTANQEP
jgi:alpha/beta superfamily hydrolase